MASAPNPSSAARSMMSVDVYGMKSTGSSDVWVWKSTLSIFEGDKVPRNQTSVGLASTLWFDVTCLVGGAMGQRPPGFAQLHRNFSMALQGARGGVDAFDNR